LKTIFGKDHGLDQKSVDFLTKALDRSNLPGFDCIEFKQSLDALSKLNIEKKKQLLNRPSLLLQLLV